jgi:hypothetical protein
MKLLDVPIGLLINFHELVLKNGIFRVILPGGNKTEGTGDIEVSLQERESHKPSFSSLPSVKKFLTALPPIHPEILMPKCDAPCRLADMF